MKAAWYERQGPARDVLVVGEMADPTPGPGEVRIAMARSGINPGDVKKRSDAFGLGMKFPRVIPHSDGAGHIDAAGEGVPRERLGARVWCFGAQSYRPFGTAAELVVVPVENTIPLPDNVSFEQGACLGIPGLTAHRAVHLAGPVNGRTVLVQGGAGSVGMAATAVARHTGARVLTTVRRAEDESVAQRAGADVVIRTDGLSPEEIAAKVLEASPGGVDHVVEVAFHANIEVDHQVLRDAGSIASYATGDPRPAIPFWNLVFKNLRLFFLGSDDFPLSAKREAGADLSAMLEASWEGYAIGDLFLLDDIASAHEAVERSRGRGRVVLDVSSGTF